MSHDHTFVAATEIAKTSRTRVFEVSDELAARSLLDWSEPVQLRLQKANPAALPGSDLDVYELVARKVGGDPE